MRDQAPVCERRSHSSSPIWPRRASRNGTSERSSARPPQYRASGSRTTWPAVSKNSSTALSSNDGELARSITTCAPATASLTPAPVMMLTALLGEAATTSWPPWRRMATVFEPIRPVPPMTTIFRIYPPLSMTNVAELVEDRGTMEQQHGLHQGLFLGELRVDQVPAHHRLRKNRRCP